MKVEREWYTQFFEQIKEWSYRFGFSFWNSSKDVMVFTRSDLTLQNTTNLVQVLTDCSRFLEQWKEETEGYIVLLDYQSQIQDISMEQTNAYLSRITEFNTTWLTSAATALLDHTAGSDGIFLHKFHKPSEDRYLFTQFFASEHSLNSVRRILSQDRAEDEVILFTTETSSGFEITLSESLDGGFPQWSWWLFCEKQHDVLEPFQRFFLNHRFHYDQGNVDVQELIERIRHPAQNLFPEDEWKDVRYMFQSVLAQQVEEQGRGVVVVEWMDRWPLETLQYLFSVLREFPVTIVTFSCTSILPFPEDVKIAHYQYTPDYSLPAEVPVWLHRMVETSSALVVYNLMQWHATHHLSGPPSASNCVWPDIIARHLSPLSLQVLYIISMLGDMANSGDILEIIHKDTVDGLRVVLIMRQLVEAGFLFRMDNSHLGFRLSSDDLRPLLPDSQDLDVKIAEYVYKAVLEERWRPLEKIFWIISPHLSDERYLLLSLFTLQYFLDRLINPRSFLQQCRTQCSKKHRSQQIQILQVIAHVEWKLIRGDVILNYDSDQLFAIDQASLAEELYAQLNITQARVALHQRRNLVATAHAKTVLALPLTSYTSRFHGLSYVVLGVLAMLRGMYRESIDYFLFVCSMKDRTDSLLPKSLANIYLCSCYFLIGHLTQLQQKAEEGKRESLRYGQHSWHGLYSFLYARTMFELGYYQETHSLCVSWDGPLKKIFERWDGRALAYLGLYTSAIDKLNALPPSVERNLFLGEAYLFSQKYHHAQEALKEGMDLVQEESLFPVPPLVIPSGIFALEGMNPELGLKELSRLLHVLYAYTLSCMGKADEALKTLEPFIPQTKGLGGGPYDPEIYFLSAEISFSNGQTNQRSVAYFSKGIVVLKERANLLQKVQLKDQYLFHHHWHSLLIQKAKEYYIT